MWGLSQTLQLSRFGKKVMAFIVWPFTENFQGRQELSQSSGKVISMFSLGEQQKNVGKATGMES